MFDSIVPTFGFIFGLLGMALGGAVGGMAGKLISNRMSGGKQQGGQPRTGPDGSSASQQVAVESEPSQVAAPVGPEETKPKSPVENIADNRASQAKKSPTQTASVTGQLTDKIASAPEMTKKPESPLKDLAGSPAEDPVKPVPKPKAPTVTSGLLAESDPSPRPSDDAKVGEDAVTQVAALGEEKTPVKTVVQGQEFGKTPEPKITEVADQIGKKPPKKLPRLKFPYTEGNPSKQPDMPNQEYAADQGYAFQGASSPNEMFQGPKYT